MIKKNASISNFVYAMFVEDNESGILTPNQQLYMDAFDIYIEN